MKVLVCGGRDYSDKVSVYSVLDSIAREEPIVLIHGDARGADRLADEWAVERGVPVVRMPANWKQYGLRAGPVRNAAMLNLKPDRVVAFTGGRGTADMVRRAEEAGVTVWKVE